MSALMRTALPLLCCFAPLVVARAGGLPEPGFIAFGEVTGAPASALTSSSLQWTNRLGGEQVVIPAKWVVVNGAVFHLAHVPFETRQITGGPRLDPTPNTFELPSTPVTFARTASLDGQPLQFVNPAQTSFTFSPADRGKVERVDLRLPDAPSDVDTDGDGMSDSAEVLAGTDPRDPDSVLRACSTLRPKLVGGEFAGLEIEWRSVPGKRYTVDRATDLAQGFQPVDPAVTATQDRTRFRDLNATGPGPFFYRIRVE